MSTTRRRGVVAATALTALLPLVALPACGDPPSAPHQPGAIALVVGGRSNMPRPQLVGKAGQMVDDAVLSKDTLFVVGVSGRPEVLYTEEISHKCDSEIACEAVVEDYRRRAEGLLGRVKAKTEEADTLAAITLAARSLSGVDNPGPKRIVVVDNGLQTIGDMQLQAVGALSVDPTQQADALARDGKLENLDGVEVLLTALGTHYAPQQPISQTGLSRLEALWAKVLEEGGATVRLDSAQLPAATPGSGLPGVATVSFDEKPPAATGSGCFRIRDDQIGFLPGRAVFRDPDQAKEILKPIARELVTKQLSATVIGTTALPERDLSNPLSRARARTVIDVLVDLKVAKRSLTPIGVGTKFAGFKPDTDAKGHLIETLAVQNRLVIIQPVGETCSA